MLRNSQIGAYVYPVVPSEFTNWRDEQRAWRETRRAVRPVAPHGRTCTSRARTRSSCSPTSAINSFANFPVNRAKQFVPCSYDGHVIGDGILFHLEAEQAACSSAARRPRTGSSSTPRPAGTTSRSTKDDRSPVATRGARPVNRKHYRYQIQGPNAWKVIEKLNGGPIPDIKFFHMGYDQHRRTQGARAAPRHGRRARAWRSGARTRSARRSAPRSSRPARSSACVQVGARAYATNTLESGWIPSPLPAVYTGEKMKTYREWLPANGYEAHRLARRQLRLEQHRGLLRRRRTSSATARSSSSTTTSSAARRSRRSPNKPHRQKVTFAWNARGRRQGLRARCSSRAQTLQVHRPAAVELRVGLVRQGR